MADADGRAGVASSGAPGSGDRGKELPVVVSAAAVGVGAI